MAVGLSVVRYAAESLHGEFGVHFRLLGSSKELHQTHSGRFNSSSIATAGSNNYRG